MPNDADRAARADAFVGGRLSRSERERAERDLERDPLFREAVMRLVGDMRRQILPGETRREPADDWKAVERGLASLPQMRPFAATEEREGTARRAPAHAIGGRRGAMLAACLAAACAAGYTAGRWAAPSARLHSAAVLVDGAGVSRAVVEADAANGLRLVVLPGMAIPRGKVAQLWLVREPPVGPVPVGVVDGPGRSHWEAPKAEAAPRYLLTLEDASGAAGGRPSAAVLADGVAIRFE